MTKKDLSKCRRQLSLKKNNILDFYGCYVNSSNHKVISKFELAATDMSETELDMYLKLLKKTMSGGLGKSLFELRMGSQSESNLMRTLQRERLKDESAREELYSKIIPHVDLKSDNFLILIASNTMDLVTEDSEDENEFSFFVCAVCPVKNASPELSYNNDSDAFRMATVGQKATAPVFGFVYPVLDTDSAYFDRSVVFCKNREEAFEDLVKDLFAPETDTPFMDTKEILSTAMTELAEQDAGCTFEVMQEFYNTVIEKAEEFDNSDCPETLLLQPSDLEALLISSGMDTDQATSVREVIEDKAGATERIAPTALLDTTKFIVSTSGAKVIVDPELVNSVRIQTIQGRRYVTIPADAGVEVNGMPVC